MSRGLRVLYLSYDGMTDPLGGSQVIPYLQGLADLGHEITIVSAEKPGRFEERREYISQVLSSSRIDWQPVRYHKSPPMLSTVWDLRQLKKKAFAIAREKKIQLVHCRSYVPAIVGLSLKRRLGTRFIFDMRGFWADERVDGGLWNLRFPPYRLAFAYFKRKERSFLSEADRIVSLTHAGRREMGNWGLPEGALDRVDVIPCCADLDHFRADRLDAAAQARARHELGLAPEDFVVSYLGSLGTWYLLDEMFRFFKRLLIVKPHAKFLFITPDDPRWVRDGATRNGVDPQAIRVIEAARPEVPCLLSLSQLGLFFIKPAYSKISSSPTKLAEILAMGIPVVTNAGVGDSDWLAKRFHTGSTVKDFTVQEFDRVLRELPEVLKMPAPQIRAVAESYFSLSKGVESYQRIYTSLAKGLD